MSNYRYDSFGNRSVLSEGVATGYGFTGQQFDEETGLGYFRARYYDPREGRFLSTDPLGFPDGPWNGYAYVANSPYDYVDPTGLTGAVSMKLFSDNAGTNDIYADAIQGAVFGWGVREILDGLRESLSYFGNDGPIEMFGEFENFEDHISKFSAICLPQDSSRIGGPGAPRDNAWRDNHGGDDHKDGIGGRLYDLFYRGGRRLVKIGAVPNPASTELNLRMNQDQQNVDNTTVSHCRPDLQYTYFGGKARMLEEFMATSGSAQTAAKALVMLYADPNASYLGFRTPYVPRSPGYRRK